MMRMCHISLNQAVLQSQVARPAVPSLSRCGSVERQDSFAHSERQSARCSSASELAPGGRAAGQLFAQWRLRPFVIDQPNSGASGVGDECAIPHPDDGCIKTVGRTGDSSLGGDNQCSTWRRCEAGGPKLECLGRPPESECQAGTRGPTRLQ